ncbi:MAG: site-2 protease family protein, partial [bacterium]|nr:site-2 protease family protein [bacterium]
TKAGIRPIVGCEITIQSGGQGNKGAFPHTWRLPVLVATQQGYRHLCRLLTRMKLAAPKGEGALGVTLVGGGAAPAGLWDGLYGGFIMASGTSWAVVTGLIGLFSEPEAVMGPVGIFRVAAGAGAVGFAYVLQLLGIISLNLAVLNLLPIPALDGGRLLFILIEKIRRKQFSPQVEARAQGISFLFLFLLIVAVTIKDVTAFF